MNRLAISFSFLLVACSTTTAPAPQSSTTNASAQPAVTAKAPAVQTVAPVASAAPTALPKAAPEKHAEKLALKRLVLARGVDKKEPSDVSTTFNAKESRVYAFVEVENPEKLPGELTVEFEPPHAGKATNEVKLAVGEGARWRTWAFTRQAHEPGEWTAIVRDAKGHELGRQTFNVEL